MLDIIKNVLTGEGFSIIPSNSSAVSLYVKYSGNVAETIQLIDCGHGMIFTGEQIAAITSKAKAYIASKGYEVSFITFFVTAQVNTMSDVVRDVSECWIIDVKTKRLLIYDNQPGDFYGLKDKLEDALFSSRQLDIAAEEQRIRENVERSRRNNAGSGYGVRNFSDYVTPVNTVIIVTNILIFIVMSIIGSTENMEFMYKHGAMYVPAVAKNKEYYRLFTCMFLHFGISHLAGNMMALFFLGDNVERAVGKIKYLIIYFGGGFIGSLGSFFYALVYNKNIISAGASGAIFAVVGALLWIVIKNNGKLEEMTTYKVGFMIIYSLYSGFTAENVDNAAHLCGLIGGLLLAMLIYKKKSSY